jgi:hypothetical protein
MELVGEKEGKTVLQTHKNVSSITPQSIQQSLSASKVTELLKNQSSIRSQ